MNWEYFIRDGRFRAKRLPPTKSTVRIKDVSDLDGLRDDLRGSLSVQDGISAYEHYFDDADLYDLEVETFEEFFNRNPNRFLGSAGKLKGHFDLIQFGLMEDYDPDIYAEWVYIDSTLGRQMAKLGIVEVKPDINEDDWNQYLGLKYTKNEIIGLGDKYSIDLKGTKEKMSSILREAIESGKIKHDKPFPIKPGPNLNSWFNRLQEEYIQIVEDALDSFDYPCHYVEAVYNEIRVEESEHLSILKALEDKPGTYVRAEQTPSIEHTPIRPSTHTSTSTSTKNDYIAEYERKYPKTGKKNEPLGITGYFFVIIGTILLLWLMN